MSLPLLCPHCRHKFDLEQAFQEVDGCKFMEVLTRLPPRLVRPLYNYIKLFAPEKHVLTWTKALKLALELEPMIKEGQIKRNGQVFVIPQVVWADAMTYLVENPPATLTKPLKSNGYLFTVLIAKAEQAVINQAEQKTAERQAVAQKLEATKQSQAKAEQQAKEKAPVDPEFKKKVLEMLSTAKKATAMTPEQQAEHQRRIQAMKESFSPEEKKKMEAMRAERAAVDPLQP
ncbi:MAG: hypothetical protein LUQ18_00015 [Methylococcaceae bacterium]|nr:hypothetical protein [Methylococcaceae bacterium]